MSQQAEIRVCKDCKHYRVGMYQGTEFPWVSTCEAPENITETISPTTGERIGVYRLKYVDNQRKHELNDNCGPEGRWFEPKEPVNVRAAFESILRMVPIPNRPQRPEIEKSIQSGSLDGYDLSDLVDAITAKAKDIAPDFEFDTTAFQAALAAIEDNPKDHEAEPYCDPDDADTGLDLERRSA